MYLTANHLIGTVSTPTDFWDFWDIKKSYTEESAITESF